MEKGLVRLSKNISYLSTSLVTTYALYILIGFTICLFHYLAPFNLGLFICLGLVFFQGSNGISSSPIHKNSYNNK